MIRRNGKLEAAEIVLIQLTLVGLLFLVSWLKDAGVL